MSLTPTGKLRPYTVLVRSGPKRGRHQIEADSWPLAFAVALEQFPETPMTVLQYFYLVEDYETKARRVVGELDIATNGFTSFRQIGSALPALSWLEARSLFGIPLTVIQADLLNKQRQILGDL